ncbi:MAG TPA: hypothetical protein VHO25_08065 [Polyangiaceae bacterium]|nr:hypothetical protein [Polyangiaceae bacterium]
MANRNWMMVAIGCSLSVLACGSSSDDGAANNTGGTSTGGTLSAGGSSGAAGSTSGGAGGAGAANGGAAGSTAGGGAGGSACTPLMPTGTAHELVISEVVPGMGIEVFNPGTTPVTVEHIWFCAQFDYKQAPAMNGQTQVPPGAYVALTWPTGDGYELTTAAGGEMLMMVNEDGFPTADTTQSYVCWGSHTGGRKDDTSVDVDLLYTGNCAPALTAGSITRRPGTDGLGAASYDTAAAPSLADCP